MRSDETKIRVRYSDVGRMGYANQAHFYDWMDIAKENFIKQYGVTYKEIEDQGYFFPIVESRCRFKNPACYDDELTIRIKIAELGAIKVSFSYEIVRERDYKVIALATSVHAFVDREFKPAVLKKAFPKLYLALSEKMNR